MPQYPSWADTFRGKVWRNVHFPRIQEDMPTFLGVPHALNEADMVNGWQPQNACASNPFGIGAATSRISTSMCLNI